MEVRHLAMIGVWRLSIAAGLIVLLAAATVAAQSPSTGSGQAFPDKPIRMIVPLPPGSASDFLARTLGLSLSNIYKQQVVVDNRPGAGGLIGSTLLTKSTPDGYTLAMIAPPHVVGPMLQASPPYRPLEDIAAVAGVATIPNMLVIAANVPAKNLQEFIAYGKANPGKLNLASVGYGTLSHLGAEIFNRAAGIRTVHVPFKLNSDVYAEMQGGRVHYFVFTVPAATPMLQDGKLRAIAVTGAKRTPAFPDVPTVAEAGLPAAQSDGWWGVIAPAGTPRRIVAKLNSDIVKLLRLPDTREKFARQGAEVIDDPTPEGFMKLMNSESLRYQQLIKDIGIKPQ